MGGVEHVGEIEILPAAGPTAVGTAVERGLSDEDRAALARAVLVLERPSLAARLSTLAGRPLDMIGRALPAVVTQRVTAVTETALRTSLRVALSTLPENRRWSSPHLHRALAATSGALGGALGLATLAVELPLSTTLMLRAIADIAREHGEDLESPEAMLACVQVFALGGRGEAGSAAESGYFAVRGALARTVTEAARHVAERGLLEEGAPVILRLVAQVAARFGVVVSQKVAAQAVPVIGALGGAAANAAFMDHFLSLARAHFTVRRLEREFGAAPVRALYEEARTAQAT